MYKISLLFFLVLFGCRQPNEINRFESNCEEIEKSIVNYKGVQSNCFKCFTNNILVEMIIDSDCIEEQYKEYYFGDFLEKTTLKKKSSNVRYLIYLDNGKKEAEPLFILTENYASGELNKNISLMLLVDSLENEFSITFCGQSRNVDSIKVVGFDRFVNHFDIRSDQGQNTPVTPNDEHIFTFKWDLESSLKGHIITYQEMALPDDPTTYVTTENIVYFDKILLNRLMERHTTSPSTP